MDKQVSPGAMKHESLKAVVYTDCGVNVWKNSGRPEAAKRINDNLWQQTQRDMFRTPKVVLFFSVRTNIMQLLEC